MNQKPFIIQDLSDDKGTVIDARQVGGGGGGSVTVDDAISSSSENPVQNKVIYTALGDKADNATVVTDLESSSVTLASAAANTIYEYGELSALTVTDITATGDFIIRFTSGSTPTTTNFPASMVFPEAFAAEASTRYEISVSNGYALVASWPVGGGGGVK